MKQTNLKHLQLDSVVLQIWDMSGEEQFRFILPNYIAGTQGLLLAFDCTNYQTLQHLNDWLTLIMPSLMKNIPLILISMKQDLS